VPFPLAPEVVIRLVQFLIDFELGLPILLFAVIYALIMGVGWFASRNPWSVTYSENRSGS
jgi:hypothetical protein